MELAELKNYLRIDHDYDDNILEMFQEIATDYINGAIEIKNPKDKRFDYAVTLLVGHWYENRLATTNQTITNIPYGVLPLIQQLRSLSNE